MKKSSEDLLVDVSTIQAENEALREQLTDLQFRLKAAEERRDSKDRYTDHEVGAELVIILAAKVAYIQDGFR